MLNLVYQKATLADLELLVTTRCIVLRAANLLPPDAPMPEVERQTRAYYQKAFAKNAHTAYLVWDGETLAGTGAVSYFQVMPTVHNPTGRKAYIMNMYTAPRYRLPAAGHCGSYTGAAGGGRAQAGRDSYLAGSNCNGQAAV